MLADKFTVTSRKADKFTVTSFVETQNFASHKQTGNKLVTR